MQQNQWGWSFPPCCRKRWDSTYFFFLCFFFSVKKKNPIIDHLYFLSEALSFPVLCWWNEITWRYSQRLNSQGTHILDSYWATGRHYPCVDEPVHQWSGLIFSPESTTYHKKAMSQEEWITKKQQHIGIITSFLMEAEILRKMNY